MTTYLEIILKQSEKKPTGALQIYCKAKPTLNHKTIRKNNVISHMLNVRNGYTAL